LIIDAGISVGAGQLYISSGAKIRLETTGRLDVGDRPGADFFLMGVLWKIIPQQAMVCF
jgi:hypothetical protein